MLVSVFGGRGKRLKSDRSWIGSMTTNREGLSDGKDECTPAIRNRASDGYQERVLVAAPKFRLAETLGGTAKPGWSPRKGRRLSPYFGASRVAIRPSLHTLTDPDANVWAHSASQFAGPDPNPHKTRTLNWQPSYPPHPRQRFRRRRRGNG